MKRGRKPVDHAGEVLWELTVLESVGPDRVRCHCSCGKEVTVRYSNVKRGNTRACGHRVTAPRTLVAGAVVGGRKILKPRTYGQVLVQCCACGATRWMKYTSLKTKVRACSSCRKKRYPYHDTKLYRCWSNARKTGRAPEWDDFLAFQEDVPELRAGLHLTRIDTTRPIGPGNFTWMTDSEITQRWVARRRHPTSQKCLAFSKRPGS